MTEQNLGRVWDLIEELTPRLKTLERQARQAREREALQNEFTLGLVRWYADRWLTPWQNRRRAMSDLEAAKVAQHLTHQAKLSHETQLKDVTGRLAEASGRLDAASRRVESLEVDLESRLLAIKSDTDRAESLGRRLAEATDTAKHWQDALADESQAVAELDRQREELTLSMEEIAEAVAATSRDADSWQHAKRALAETTRRRRNELANAESNRSRALVRARDVEERLAQVQRNLREQQRQTAQLQEEIAAQSPEVADLTRTLAETQSAIKAHEGTLQSVTYELEKSNRVALASAQRADEVDREYQLLVTRLETLRSVEESGAGYFPGVRAVLRAARSHPTSTLAGIIDIVARLLEVPDDLELAIETALGSHGQDIVVERWIEAEAAISLLKATGGGRATFLPLDTLRPPRRSESPPSGPGVIGVASNLVTIDRRYAIVGDFLLSQALLVDDLNVARVVLQTCAPFWQIVTRDGEVARPSGVVTGGSAPTSRGALTRHRELRASIRFESEASARRERTRRESAACGESVKGARLAATSADHALQTARETLRRTQLGLRDAQARLDRSDRLATAQESENKRLQTELANLEARQWEAGEAVNLTVLAVETAKSALEIAESVDQEFSAVERDPIAIAAEARGRLDLANTRRKGVDAERQRTEARQKSIRDRIRGYDLQTTTNQAELTGVSERLANERREIAELNQAVVSARDNLGQLTTESGAIHTRHERLAADCRASDVLVNQTDTVAREVFSRLEKADLELDGLRRQVMLELGPIDQEAIDDGHFAVQLGDGVTRSAPLVTIGHDERLKDRLDTLRSRLKLMTDGIDAVAEYEAARERLDFLREQHGDLTRSTQTLRAAIDETRTTMRERFDITFAQVGAAFSRRFAELFAGGTAKLVLDADGSGTGIDVLAQPPGKRSQSLATLSGGERALTAASLLFALIEASPPPFCLLDEVDAALDENNVTRFCATLKELAAKTQFLVITHNRRTMEAASAICGLTLEGRCETKVLSMRLPIGS